MPRVKRNRGESGIYHIIMRGINRQTIFEDDEDCKKFVHVLHKYKQICDYELYAYCLMGNHLHLLLREGKELLDQIMRRICCSYVYWYNQKYGRIGYLFQDRYGSEPVDENEYFLTVLRYIYQNPLKAGLALYIEEYPWSNYNDYLSKSEKSDFNFVLNMFNDNREKGIKEFIRYINTPNQDVRLDVEEKSKVSDKDAGVIIRNVCNIENLTEFQRFDKLIRDNYLKKLKLINRMSIRQIERLTGINRGVIAKA